MHSAHMSAAGRDWYACVESVRIIYDRPHRNRTVFVDARVGFWHFSPQRPTIPLLVYLMLVQGVDTALCLKAGLGGEIQLGKVRQLIGDDSARHVSPENEST